jgi:hypothetical protein
MIDALSEVGHLSAADLGVTKQHLGCCTSCGAQSDVQHYHAAFHISKSLLLLFLFIVFVIFYSGLDIPATDTENPLIRVSSKRRTRSSKAAAAASVQLPQQVPTVAELVAQALNSSEASIIGS